VRNLSTKGPADFERRSRYLRLFFVTDRHARPFLCEFSCLLIGRSVREFVAASSSAAGDGGELEQRVFMEGVGFDLARPSAALLVFRPFLRYQNCETPPPICARARAV
jgi:hypothetical protein